MSEPITTATAAHLLGLTDARVRQLVAEGTLSVRRLGARTVLLDAAEVLLYRDLTDGIVTATTAVAATAASTAALPEVVDRVWKIDPGPWDTPGAVHVRIWSDSHRTVVVVGPVAESPVEPNSWHLGAFIAPQIIAAHDAVDLGSSETIWLTIGSGIGGLPVLANPVLTGTGKVRWLGPVDWDHADRCLGRRLRAFPDRQLATVAAIAALAEADRHPIILAAGSDTDSPPWVHDLAVRSRSLAMPRDRVSGSTGGEATRPATIAQERRTHG